MNINKFFKDYFKDYAKQSRKGYTLVELIAVVAIIAITSTATLSVFVAVQQTVRDTSNITKNQFNTTQIERYIRDQFQTASFIDVYSVMPNKDEPNFAGIYTPEENDEFLVYKPKEKQLKFYRYGETGDTRTILAIDDVTDVTISICPVSFKDGMNSPEKAANMPYKLIYKIVTKSYTYSGGIVLGNTRVDDDNLTNYNATSIQSKKNYVELKWNSGSSDNNKCITFHLEVPVDLDNATT